MTSHGLLAAMCCCCVIVASANRVAGHNAREHTAWRRDNSKTGQTRHSLPDVADFYKYYTRNVEDFIWGEPLSAGTPVKTSALGVFLILWTKYTDDERVKMKRCLQSLDVYFNDRYDYPVIIMHEDMPVSTQHDVASWTRSRIAFVGKTLIDTDYGAAFNRTGLPVHPWYTDNHGYLHMIRHTYRWPLHRALFGYRYVFKIDSDAYFAEPVTEDVFQVMLARDAKAGFFTHVIDNPSVCENLYETAEDVLRYNQLHPAQDIYRVPKYWTWYGFALIFDTAFVRSPAFLNTLWHFDNLHGPFRYRWGDPQLTLLTSMFLTDRQVIRLDTPLAHQGVCVNTKSSASCNVTEISDWAGAHKNVTTPVVDWTWRPNHAWSKQLWPVDPVTQPPYCLPESLCRVGG